MHQLKRGVYKQGGATSFKERQALAPVSPAQTYYVKCAATQCIVLY